MYKLLDAEFPISDDTFQQIANGDNSDETSIAQDWQMPDPFLGHDGHANFGALPWLHVDNF
jgi:hypothetical protein